MQNKQVSKRAEKNEGDSPSFLEQVCDCFLCECVEQWSGAKQKGEWRVARERLATNATMPQCLFVLRSGIAEHSHTKS